jgi:hypothetical protein
MKNRILILSFLLGVSVALEAQPELPITFDDTSSVNYMLDDFAGNTSSIAVDPVDAGNLVAMAIRDSMALTYAGTTMGGSGLASAIPFTATDTRIMVRVYAPDINIPILLKVENAASGSIFAEILVNTTLANAWDTLEFDFSSVLNLSQTYDKISIFFNFGTSGAAAGQQTYYWDDVELILGGGMVLDPPDLPITFEDTATVNYNLTDFNGNNSDIVIDPINANNLVGMVIRDSTAAPTAGTTMGSNGLANPIPFATTATRIRVLVYAPAIDIPIMLKVEDSANPGIFGEVIVNTTMANAWDTLIFDYSSVINLTNTYNKISIFFNFGTNGMTAGQQTYYWDNVEFIGGGMILGPPDLPITFEDTASVNYNLVDFGGTSSSISADPVNPGNLVGKVIKSNTATGSAGTFMGGSGLANPIPFTAINRKIRIRVFSPDVNTPVFLKAESSTPGVVSTVTVNTTIANAWDTLIFDFGLGAPPVDPGNTYNILSIAFNFGIDGATAGEKTYYWDDVELIECESLLHVSGSLVSETYSAIDDITSDAFIASPQNVIFKASNSILLGKNSVGEGANFEVQLGAEFRTILLPCGVDP